VNSEKNSSHAVLSEKYNTLVYVQGSRAAKHIGVVTEWITLLISSGFKMEFAMPKLCKYKYFHVKIASLPIVNP